MITANITGSEYSFVKPEPFIRREGRPEISQLTIICCCAGYGKTAYLAQLNDEIENSIFISFDKLDDSPSRIVNLLGRSIPELSCVYDSDIPGFMEEVISVLYQRGITLLIDNADRLTSPQAASVFDILVQAAVRGNFRMVFAVRQIPGFLLGYVMDGIAVLMGADEMSFTASETASLADKLCPDASDSFISSLHSFSGGWCIAAALLAGADEGELSYFADRSFLPEYIKYNITDPLDEDLRRYLHASAFLHGDDDFFREGLRLPDASYSRGIITRMGIASAGNGEITYPEVMRYILSHFIPEKEKNDLIKKASGYYIDNKRFAEAVKLFEVSGNASAAESILAMYGGRMLDNCEFELIGYCGSIIGNVEKVRDPDALGALAQYYYYNGEYKKMEQAFNLADSMFGKENRFSVLRKLYKGLLKYNLRPGLYSENITSAIEWLRENDQPMPFLYSKELGILENMGKEKSGSENPRLLYIRRFGGLHITAGENRTEIQCKTKRSTEIIAYMLEQGGKPVSREKLLNALWPEDMPANAVAMLHNMIYHLRRVLTEYGLENIIMYKNKYYSINEKLVADEDKELISACIAGGSGDTGFLLGHDEILRNYPGRYLEGTDSFWASEKREYYDRCYISACTLVSEGYISEGRFEEAELLLKNAYRLDPYSEQLVYGLLSCYSGLGKPDKVRECFEEYTEKLDLEFGTRPGKWLRKYFLSCFSDEPEYSL